ncbi:MAG: hypothetical protein AAF581_11055 [Planctomycetota bacterium]
MALQMKYFVLKPKGTSPYAVASRKAMRAYAKHIKKWDRELAAELQDWADDEWQLVLPAGSDERSG